jgi:hypothetical protein
MTRNRIVFMCRGFIYHKFNNFTSGKLILKALNSTT